MSFKSDLGPFRSKLAETAFVNKYRHPGCETWDDLSRTLVDHVCGEILSKEDCDAVYEAIKKMKFIPGGRYLYYAGRSPAFFNNCFLLKSEEDSREDWAELSKKAELCLMSGGGIGNDYSVYRPFGSTIKKTGGKASGPIPKMFMINEIGRNVIQGGSRRSAIYASLNWKHGDVDKFLTAKNWDKIPAGTSGLTMGDLKKQDFNFNAPLDMTNISVNYDTEWLMSYFKTGKMGSVFNLNALQALSTGEPGFSFNFFDKEKETLRNACTEVTSEDDSDVCNLGSLNFSRIESIEELEEITALGTMFLLCGTIKADLPYDKIRLVREKNRRLGLGIMGLHEWLLKRGYRYEVCQELHSWLSVYKGTSAATAKFMSGHLGISNPVANRAIAPTGTIGLIAGTTQGIEPVYAAAYKRRYLVNGTTWKHQFAVDHVAELLHREYSIDPDSIESSVDLSKRYEDRIKFQADVQDYVDMSISSTINVPAWNPNNPAIDPGEFAACLAKYAPRLRGFTAYPDGSRGGQPLTKIEYKEAVSKLGNEYDEETTVYTDVCDLTGKGICAS